MKLSWKVRKEMFVPHMTQEEIAAAISDETVRVTRADLNLVMNGKDNTGPRFNRIRVRLDRFLTEKEKEVT